MQISGDLVFLAPLALLGLLALPVVWLLLRSLPPPAVRRLFPPVVLLSRLSDRDVVPEKIPLWLRLLRILALICAIIGFAEPVINPERDLLESRSSNILIALDGSWASAQHWQSRIEAVDELLNEARARGQAADVIILSRLPVEGVRFRNSESWLQRLPTLEPSAWEPDYEQVIEWAKTNLPPELDTYWISDEVARNARERLALEFSRRGNLQVLAAREDTITIRPATFETGELLTTITRLERDQSREVDILVLGTTPSGREVVLLSSKAILSQGELAREIRIAVPPELRNRITRLEISGVDSAGSVSLAGNSLSSSRIVLSDGRLDSELPSLLDSRHYLQQSLGTLGEVSLASVTDGVRSNPDVVVLDDLAELAEDEETELLEWIRNGGLLIRFSGRHTANSSVSRESEHPLFPVRLRRGGRAIGGALSWGAPRGIREFGNDSPFQGLEIPRDVQISAQILAQPDANLSEKVIAELSDGTTLVTQKLYGDGRIVLFHVSADLEWSNLPISGLFLEMLERLTAFSVAGMQSLPDHAESMIWRPISTLDAFGSLVPPEPELNVGGSLLLTQTVSGEMPPGLYTSGNIVIPVNAVTEGRSLEKQAWGGAFNHRYFGPSDQIELKAMFLIASLIFFILEVAGTLIATGVRHSRNGKAILATLLIAATGPLDATSADAQQFEATAIALTETAALAYVETGNRQVDEISRLGLASLSEQLRNRTNISIGEPQALSLGADEMAFFPLVYWPIPVDHRPVTTEALEAARRYMQHGGLILIDTLDGDLSVLGVESANLEVFRRIVSGLDIPPLEQVDESHVLSRTFYLLDFFPGRFGAPVWVEATYGNSGADSAFVVGSANDGVSPVVIGGNDWASAWATDARGRSLFPVSLGMPVADPREHAFRFGVNVVMYAVAGNYKSDQLHVDALLDRMGQ